MGGETEDKPSAWTIDSLHAHVQQQITDLRTMLNERYETQTRAVDAAFLAQRTAMETALTAAERAVATALLSAEKAVVKAESAAEKRFEAVNEFRGQLADQAATLISRSEVEARIDALTDKMETETARTTTRINELITRFSEVETRLTSRLDLSAGAHSGVNEQTNTQREQTNSSRRDLALSVTIGGFVLAIVIAVLTMLK